MALYNTDLDNHLRFLDEMLVSFSEKGWDEVASSNWNPLPGQANPIPMRWNTLAPGTAPVAVPAVYKRGIKQVPCLQRGLDGLPIFPSPSWWPDQDKPDPVVLGRDPWILKEGMEPPFEDPPTFFGIGSTRVDETTLGRNPLSLPDPPSAADYYGGPQLYGGQYAPDATLPGFEQYYNSQLPISVPTPPPPPPSPSTNPIPPPSLPSQPIALAQGPRPPPPPPYANPGTSCSSGKCQRPPNQPPAAVAVNMAQGMARGAPHPYHTAQFPMTPHRPTSYSDHNRTDKVIREEIERDVDGGDIELEERQINRGPPPTNNSRSSQIQPARGPQPPPPPVLERQNSLPPVVPPEHWPRRHVPANKHNVDANLYQPNPIDQHGLWRASSMYPAGTRRTVPRRDWHNGQMPEDRITGGPQNDATIGYRQNLAMNEFVAQSPYYNQA